jgi:hypothetical protein
MDDMSPGSRASRPPGHTVRARRRLLVAVTRNPLARAWDRIEAVLLLALIGAAVLALPVAAGMGSSIFADQMTASAVQTGTRHQVTATLRSRSPAPATIAGDVTRSAATVTASWTLPDGAVRSGEITIAAGDLATATTRIWIDGTGRQTSAPLSAGGAVFTAVVAGVFIESSVLIALAGLYLAGRFVLDRRRIRQWDVEWARLAGRGTVH